MNRIVLINQDHGRLQKLRDLMNSFKSRIENMDLVSVHPNFIQSAIDHNVNLVVLEIQQINELIYKLIENTRKLGFQGPIILLGYLPSGFKIEELAKIPNLHYLEKPFEKHQLLGIVKNCLNSRNLKQRRDQRFEVREQATLEAYSSDFSTEAIIINVSKTGARIEGNLSQVKIGDVIRIHFNFTQLNKTRTMSARIVWLKKESDNKEVAGLEFVSQKDVYKYLLDYAVA